MVELWLRRRSGTTLKQWDDRPWDDPNRRPSHADRLKTLKRRTLRETFSALPRRQRAARKIQRLFQALARMVNCTKELAESADREFSGLFQDFQPILPTSSLG